MNVRELDLEEFRRRRISFSEFESKTLFHEPAWLDYLLAIGKGVPRVLELTDETGPRSAYQVFLDTSIGPFKVMGSPLPGWTTNFMGPLVRDAEDFPDAIKTIKDYVRRRRYVYVEIKNKHLPEEVMRDLGFHRIHQVTAILDLRRGEEELWAGLKSTARNRIRKAQKKLHVEITSDRNLIIKYYEMIVSRYREQGIEFPFGVERLVALVDALEPNGLILMARVFCDDDLAAAGIFPFDENCIYYFGGASDRRFNKYCPNDLMHWTIIREATKRNIGEYDLCGTSQFKRKFGSQDVETPAWSYSPLPGLIIARNLLLKAYWQRLRLIRKIKSFFSS